MNPSFARSHGLARSGPPVVAPPAGSWSSAHAGKAATLSGVLGNAAFLRASAARRLQTAGRTVRNPGAR
jgi:hypothetical protein